MLAIEVTDCGTKVYHQEKHHAADHDNHETGVGQKFLAWSLPARLASLSEARDFPSTHLATDRLVRQPESDW